MSIITEKRFTEYQKIIGKEKFSVLLSRNSKRTRPHFFKNKRTADKKAIELKELGLKAKVKPFRRSYVIFFKPKRFKES